MTEQQVINYWDNHKWFSVGICFRHEDELRTAYFRAESVQQAIKQFDKVTNDPILNVWLFDDEDVFE